MLSAEEKAELVELIAQAVIDKIDERERINRLADVVVARVLALQEEEATLAAQVVVKSELSEE